MNKNSSPKLNSSDQSNMSINNQNFEQRNQNDIKSLRNEISALSYEDSLNKLDILLDHLKNDKLLVQELRSYFLKGTLYIEHCENLLNKVEQEVLEIDYDDLA